MKKYLFIFVIIALLTGCVEECTPSRRYEYMQVDNDRYLQAAKAYADLSGHKLLQCASDSENIAVSQLTVNVKFYSCQNDAGNGLTEIIKCEPARLSNNQVFAYCHPTGDTIFKAK